MAQKVVQFGVHFFLPIPVIAQPEVPTIEFVQCALRLGIVHAGSEGKAALDTRLQRAIHADANNVRVGEIVAEEVDVRWPAAITDQHGFGNGMAVG